jgi:hypothetical protein
MKIIKLTGPDKKSTFELHIYKAGETADIFQGATGVFGKAAGSKTAGIVYVTKGGHGITAQDDHVDNGQTWDWIQTWMQKGMDAEADKITITPAADAVRPIKTELEDEAGHTQGPLKVARLFVENQPEQWAVTTGKWGAPVVAICPREDDATLFASAPELLRQRDEAVKALKRINRTDVSTFHGDSDRYREWLQAFTSSVISSVESGVGK